MFYIGTVYVTVRNAIGTEPDRMLGPFVRRLEARVPEDFKYLAQQDMERAWANVVEVEVGPVSLSKKQESLPLK